jgi:hypothetical protein
MSEFITESTDFLLKLGIEITDIHYSKINGYPIIKIENNNFGYFKKIRKYFKIDIFRILENNISSAHYNPTPITKTFYNNEINDINEIIIILNDFTDNAKILLQRKQKLKKLNIICQK